MFVFAIIAATDGSAAAQITADQQSAIRGSCQSDFQSKCSGITPGGKDALTCLQKNVASLSPACKTAVSATLHEPAQAATPHTPTAAVAPLTPRKIILPQRRLVIEGICHSDAAKLCAGMLPIGSKMIDCLAEHASSLSQQCYNAIARISQ
jgi:hypothetical protein